MFPLQLSPGAWGQCMEQPHLQTKRGAFKAVCVWGKELQDALNSIVMWGKWECAQNLNKGLV